MPVAVRVVSQDEFNKWVDQKKKAAGLVPGTAPQGAPKSDVASAHPPANR
jgi:heme/copper-type cytochrome/quinol oxidase subunit 2